MLLRVGNGWGDGMKRLERTQTPPEARALRLLRALGSPVRLRIVEIVAERKDCMAP